MPLIADIGAAIRIGLPRTMSLIKAVQNKISLLLLSLDGDMSTSIDGTRYLVNSGSGDNVVSTTGVQKVFDGTQSLTLNFVASNYVMYLKDDVLIEANTVGQTSLLLDGIFTHGSAVALLNEPTAEEKIYIRDNLELFFAHCNTNSAYADSNLSFPKTDCKLNAPLSDIGAVQTDYATNTTYTITNYLSANEVIGKSKGLQLVKFNSDMSLADGMGFDATQADQLVNITTGIGTITATTVIKAETIIRKAL